MSDELRVLLVTPVRRLSNLPSLGLAHLASYLGAFGGRTTRLALADENVGENVERSISSFRPHVVGFTAATPQITRAGHLAEYAKNVNRECLTVVGGPHATVLPGRTLEQFPGFDVAVVGEGEQTFVDLVDAYVGDRDDLLHELERVPGLALRLDGETVVTPRRELIRDLDSVPIPDRRIFDEKRYFGRPRSVIKGLVGIGTHVLTSRGCPFDCTYCASKVIWQRRVRFFSPEHVLAEVDELIERYGVEHLCINDDLFLAKKDRAVAICNAFVERGYPGRLRWSALSRARDVLTPDAPELLRLMKEAGCVQLEFGFESGSPRTLQEVKRGTTTVEQNQAAIDAVSEAGIRVVGFFMVGFQGESDEDVRATRDFVVRNRKKLGSVLSFLAIPYPGTDLWQDCVDAGVVDEGGTWDDFMMDSRERVFSDTVNPIVVREVLTELDVLSANRNSPGSRLRAAWTLLRDSPGMFLYQLGRAAGRYSRVLWRRIVPGSESNRSVAS